MIKYHKIFVNKIMNYIINYLLNIKSTNKFKICRLGTLYGGWSIPKNIINAHSICYCFGAGEDISFDCSLIENFNCDVYTFDPTPKSITHVTELINRVKLNKTYSINNSKKNYYAIKASCIDKLHFKPFGVWSKNGMQKFYAPQKAEHVSHSILNLQKTDKFFNAECFTLKTIMDIYGHNMLDLLKLDIEGAEYEVIKSLIQDNIKIKILLIEFDEGHNAIDKGYFNRIRDANRSLINYGMVPILRENWNITYLSYDQYFRYI